MNKLWTLYDDVKIFFMLLAMVPIMFAWWAIETRHWSDKHIVRILELYISIKEAIINVKHRFNNS